MKGNHSRDLRAGTRQLQHSGTAEAITDRRDFPLVRPLILLQHIQASEQPAAEKLPVFLVFSRLLACRRGLRADTRAIDIRSNHVIPGLRQHSRAHLLVVAEPRPLMDDQHRRSLALDPVVIGLEPFQFHALMLILNHLLDDLGLQRQDAQQHCGKSR